MKVFLYDNTLDLGLGQLARVDGYQLTMMPHTFSSSPEAVPNAKKSIYGYVYDVSVDMFEYLDAYYCVGAGLHTRVKVEAYVEGGRAYTVTMYEYNNVAMAKK
jgi:gamma-glutamylcyclotransferase (GGCT)/AIG2-like uncharacterized protein YtfP